MDHADSPLKAQLENLLGSRFVLGNELAEGGFARVFEAFDTRLGSRVAAKVLHPELVRDSVAEERFLREIRFLAQLRHPHIVPILDAFQGDGLNAYLMPLIEGASLRARLSRSGALPLEETVRLVVEIGEAIDFAHRKNVLHRDLKPENILLSDGHAQLADFGIARALEGPDSKMLTQTGWIVGSSGYMSPEQASGSGSLDGRSDIYSLAAVAYEMIAGRPAFVASTAEGIYRQQISRTLTPLPVLRSSVSEALDAAVARGLEPNPADRYATASEFAQACRNALDDTAGIRIPTPSLAPVTPTPTEQRRSGPRPVRLLLVAGLAVAGVAAVFGLSRLTSDRKPVPPSSAEERAWFVVAQVETNPLDRDLAASVGSILRSTFEQSPVLGVLTDQEVAGTLRSAGRPESAVVNSALARELSFRARARGVLEANVDHIGSGGVISLRAVDSEFDSVLLSERTRFDKDSELLKTVERLAKKARTRLEPGAKGLYTEKQRGVTEATTVLTKDFQAWKLFSKAVRLHEAGQHRAAIPFFREALMRDSTFAWAWNGLGNVYGNTGFRDSAMFAFTQDLKYIEKHRPHVQWLIRAALHSMRNESMENLAIIDRVLVQEPRSSALWNNRAEALRGLGRYEESLESYRRARDLPSTFAQDFLLQNEIITWIAMGRLDQADSLCRQLSEDSVRRPTRLWIALANSDEVETEKAARDLTGPASDPTAQREAQVALAACLSGRGRLHDARNELANSRERAAEAEDARNLFAVEWADALLLLVYGREASHPNVPKRTDMSLDGRITQAVVALAHGDRNRARGIAKELAEEFRAYPRMLEGAPELLQAWASAEEGQWKEIPTLCRPIARGPWGSWFSIRRPAARWLVARAFEQTGQLDSAATYYRLCLSTLDLDSEELGALALIRAPALQRLALVELKRGRTEEAEELASQFSRMFNQPDPELRPLRDELAMSIALAGDRRTDQPTKRPAQDRPSSDNRSRAP